MELGLFILFVVAVAGAALWRDRADEPDDITTDDTAW